MHKSKSLLRTTLMMGVAAVTTLSLSSGIYAADDDAGVETVVVTGSRIPQTNLYSASPVTTLSKDDITYDGSTTAEDLLNKLPTVFASQNSSVANGATGTATVDMHGLGAERTLVLVDGLRLMPGAPDEEAADINIIPTALLENVETYTGGASTTYGSDAVGGVVNFKMRRDFEGFEIDAQGGINMHNNGNSMMQGVLDEAGYSYPTGNKFDGENADITAMFGANTADGRGNVTMYFGYRVQRAVSQSNRDWSACATGLNDDMKTYSCSGSGTIAAGRFYSVDSSGGAYSSGAVLSEDGGIHALDSSDLYNYGPLNYLERPDTRYTAGAFAHYDVNSHLKLQGSFMFMDDHTVAQIAPSGAFYGTAYTVNCDNPYLEENSSLHEYLCTDAGLTDDDDATVYIGRRLVEGGARQDDLRHTDYRITIGASGNIIPGIDYQLTGQYSTAIYAENYLNDVSVSNVQDGLEAEYDDDGNIVCSSGDDGCVALNIFNYNGLTSDMVDYMKADGLKKGSTTERIIDLNFTVDLGQFGVKSPWASSGAFTNFGYEYRDEDLVYRTDEEFQSGDLAGQGGDTPSVYGSYNVSEGFIEAQAPIVDNLPFVQNFTINLGLRYSSYNVQGNATTYKYGFTWQSTDDVMIRGSYNRAVRAPNINELYGVQYQNLYNGTDPCAGSDPTYTLQECENTGVTAAQYGTIQDCSSSQCSAYYGGNENLKPEKANTWSIGLVLTPEMIPGFTFSADYYRIMVHDMIDSVDPGIIVKMCAKTGDSSYCDLIHRSSSTGILFGSGSGSGYVASIDTNTGFLRTQGMDFKWTYLFDLDMVGLPGMGSIATTFNGTYMWDYTRQDYTGDTPYNCAGYFGLTCQTPNPKWRHVMRMTWSAPWDLNLSLAWRYYGKVSFDGNASSAKLNDGEDYDYADSHIADYSYFDLAGQWTVMKGLTMRFTINNIFDKDPPVVDSASLGISGSPYGNGNTYPGVYDALGRVMSIGATLKL